MRDFFQNGWIGAKASLSFLAALFARRDKVVGVTKEGFPLLAGWQDSPVESLVARSRVALARRQAPLRAALYGVEGAHAGEVIPLRREVETLGPSARHSIVVTPANGTALTYVQVVANPRLRVNAEPGHSFRVNGLDEHSCDLYDFDQLEFLGNRFLTLDMTNTVPEGVES